MERTPVESNCLLKSIDCFDWSKIFFKLIAKSFLCWFLTCIFFIYWISANWSWNASLGVISNYLWDVYKYYIRIFRIKFLFTMSYLVSFGTDCQYMFYMSKVLFKRYDWWSPCAPISTWLYLRQNNLLHKNLVKLCCEVHYMWWWNQ